MFIVFYDWSVPYEAEGSTFIAACDSLETALGVLRKVAAIFLKKQKVEPYERVTDYQSSIADYQVMRNKDIDKALELLQYATSTFDVNEIWCTLDFNRDSSWSIQEDVPLVTDPEIYVSEHE